jgi:hypothetical protein
MAAPNSTTYKDAINLIASTESLLNVATKVGAGEAAPQELVTAATGFVSAATALSESPGMTTLSKITGFTSGITALAADVPALQTSINAGNASGIALNALKVTSDTCGSVAPLATAAAAIADSNPATIGELGAPLTALAAATDTCAISTAALVAGVESGEIILNTSAAIQQYLNDADTDITNGFIDNMMDNLISGTAVGVPGSDLIANGATLTAQTAAGPITTIGFNDSVNTQEFVGKGGSPVGASVTAYGGQTTVTANGLVDSGFSEMTPNSTLTVSTPSSGSVVNANDNLADTLVIDGGFPSDTSAVENIGAGSAITLNIANDTVSSMSSGVAVAIEGGMTLDKVDGSGETVSIGNSADGTVDGANNIINAGSSSKVEDDGTGSVVTTSNSTVYVAAGDHVVVDGNNDHVIGAGSDTIVDNGTGDNLYADNSSITFSGVNTGDVVHGQSDTGTDWGGYIDTGGAYGGYGGGGYYAAVRPGNLAAAKSASGRNIDSIATLASASASAAIAHVSTHEVRIDGGVNIARLAEVTQESTTFTTAGPQISRVQAAVHPASVTASLVQSMAAWAVSPSASSTHDAQDIHNQAPQWHDSLGLERSIGRSLAIQHASR